MPRRNAHRRYSMRGFLLGERLEDRRLCVVGQTTFATPTLRGTGYDGVVGIDLGRDSTEAFLSAECTGVLLYDRMHVLTAAHCLDDDGDRVADRPVRIVFDIDTAPTNRFLMMDVPIASIEIHPNWSDVIFGNDIAILTLPALAPRGAEGYPIYDGVAEVGQNFTLVGYGRTGSGTVGQNDDNTGSNGDIRRKGENRYDALADNLDGPPLFEPSAPAAGLALASDFDNGTVQRDAFGTLYNLPQRGVPNGDGLAAQGDSGGPTFLGTPQTGLQIAGIVSYGVDKTNNSRLTPDTDNDLITFGEINVDTRVSAFAKFITTAVNRSKTFLLDINSQPDGVFGSGDIEIDLSYANGKLSVSMGEDIILPPTDPANITTLTILGDKDNRREVLSFTDLTDELLGKLKLELAGGSDSLVFQGELGLRHTQPLNSLDVNADGRVNPLDALVVINAINEGKGGSLAEKTLPGSPYYDVSKDGRLSALDVLRIINFINGGGTSASVALNSEPDAAEAFLETPQSPAGRARTMAAIELNSESEIALAIALRYALDNFDEVAE